jgi:protein phosphatase
LSGDTQPDTEEDIQLPLSGVPVRVDIAGLTHAGKTRENNEDNFHVVQFGRYLRTLASSLVVGGPPDNVDQPGYGYAIADGLGGHPGGEVASRLAITLLVDYALQTPDWIIGHEDHMLARVLERWMRRFQFVNEEVIARAKGLSGLTGMATTLSLAMSLGDDLLLTHVGDSRIYLLRQGALHRLTRDHTALRLRVAPQPGAARFRYVLTHAIGMPDSGGDPDIRRCKLLDGDRLLLCTDGLTNMADDQTIARVLGAAASAEEACQSLVELALERGGLDNVTVVVGAYRIP